MTELSIEMRPIAALRPWARNARTHSRKQIRQIADSIRTFGFTNPVLIDAADTILAGHGRVEAARLLGMDRVPCVRLEHMTPAQKRAYVLADNKLALNAGWDEQILGEELTLNRRRRSTRPRISVVCEDIDLASPLAPNHSQHPAPARPSAQGGLRRRLTYLLEINALKGNEELGSREKPFMFRRIAERMGKLLLEVAAECPHAVAQPPPRTPVGICVATRQFETRGRQVLAAKRASSPTVLAGTVQLLGLDEIRKAVGGGWSQIADQAHAVAGKVIGARLGPDDLFSLHDNDSYVLCFPHLDEAAARRKTAGITAEIKAEIIKAVEGGERIGVAEFIAEVEFAPALDSDRPLADILADSLKDIRKEAEEAYQRHRAALLKEAEVFFRPVWHADKRKVDLYRSVLDERTGRSSLDYLRSLSTPDEIQAAMAELDMLIFSHTVKELHRSLLSNGKGTFLIPVHFNTINVRQLREEFFKLCQAVPHAYKSFVLLELYGIPAGTPASRLRDLAPLLRPACEGVVFEAPLTDRNVQEFRAAGVYGLSADVRTSQDNPAALQPRFLRGNKAAQEAGLQTIAHGADTMGLLQEAVRAGFSYVSGQGIAPSSDRTRGAYLLSPLSGTVAGRRDALSTANV